jgi:hypothetical protein
MQEYLCKCEHCQKIREQQRKHSEWLRGGLTKSHNLIKIKKSSTKDFIYAQHRNKTRLSSGHD